MGDARAGGAGSGIVVDDVKAAPVGMEVVRQGGVGVGGRDFTETRMGADAGGPQEKFEVHCVVDDDGEIPAVAFVPGRDGADFGSETGAEGVGTGEENVPVGGVTAEAEVVAEASGAREAEVVRAAVVFGRFEPGRRREGGGAERGVSVSLGAVPPRAGEEPARPVLIADEFEFAFFERARVAGLAFDRFEHAARLGGGEGEILPDNFGQRRFGGTETGGGNEPGEGTTEEAGERLGFAGSQSRRRERREDGRGG